MAQRPIGDVASLRPVVPRPPVRRGHRRRGVAAARAAGGPGAGAATLRGRRCGGRGGTAGAAGGLLRSRQRSGRSGGRGAECVPCWAGTDLVGARVLPGVSRFGSPAWIPPLGTGPDQGIDARRYRRVPAGPAAADRHGGGGDAAGRERARGAPRAEAPGRVGWPRPGAARHSAMGGAVRHRKGMPKRKTNRPTQRTPRRATAAARGAEPQGRLATALAVYNPDMLAACTEVGAIDYRLAVDLAPSWYRGTVTGRKLADFDPIEQVSLIAVIRALDDPVTGNLVHAHTDALADYLDQLCRTAGPPRRVGRHRRGHGPRDPRCAGDASCRLRGRALRLPRRR